MPQSMSFTAALSADTPAFVREPTLVFARAIPAPSRSEVLRQQIEAAWSTRARV